MYTLWPLKTNAARANDHLGPGVVLGRRQRAAPLHHSIASDTKLWLLLFINSSFCEAGKPTRLSASSERPRGVNHPSVPKTRLYPTIVPTTQSSKRARRSFPFVCSSELFLSCVRVSFPLVERELKKKKNQLKKTKKQQGKKKRKSEKSVSE